MTNKFLNAAKVNENDEFYTQLSDIEKELQHYISRTKLFTAIAMTQVLAISFVTFSTTSNSWA